MAERKILREAVDEFLLCENTEKYISILLGKKRGVFYALTYFLELKKFRNVSVLWAERNPAEKEYVELIFADFEEGVCTSARQRRNEC